MKKSLTVLLSLLLISTFLLSFAYGQEATAEKIQIVATIFPAFDFARQIAGENADVTLLLPPGSDSHSFDPTPQDILAIQNADLFIFNGGESDVWVRRLLDSLGTDAPQVFIMSECIPQDEALHQHTENDSHHDHAHDEQLDEHIWTSPRNVMLIAAGLSEKLSALSPELAKSFEQNQTAFQQELVKLDAALTEVTANGLRHTIVFGDRFPFRHLTNAYCLEAESAFPGCSEDSEPSIKTLARLTKLIRGEQIPVIFHIEFSNTRTADILAEETDAKVMLLHSCHTVSHEEIDEGVTYLSLMWQNVDALKEALN